MNLKCIKLLIPGWDACQISAGGRELRLPGAAFGPPEDRCKPPPLHQDLNLIPSSALRFADPYVIAPAAETTDTQSMNVISDGTLTFKSYREMLFTYRSWNGSGQVRLTNAPPEHVWGLLAVRLLKCAKGYKTMQLKGIISTTLSYILQLYIFDPILKLNWFQ